MPRRARSAPPDQADTRLDDAAPGAGLSGHEGQSGGGTASGIPDLSTLPVAGITRRRMAFLTVGFVTVWMVVLFARQVGDASTATARAAVMQAGNEQLAAHVAALEEELQLIQQQRFIVQQARGYRLGEPNEIPFSLTDAPPLAGDAPGSPAVRLGAPEPPMTPLESWLSLLFGPVR